MLSSKEKLIKARIELQKENPFFSYLVMHLRFIPDRKDILPCSTVGVDGYGNLYYNEKFIEGLSIKTCKEILCHEVLHVVLEHMKRVEQRDKRIWNIAIDLAVNYILRQHGMNLTKDALVPDKNGFFKKFNINVKGKIAEQIYTELYNKVPRMLKIQKDIHIYRGSNKLQKSYKDQKNLRTEKVDWKKILREAEVHSKIHGVEPLGIERDIDFLFRYKINWKSLLWKYIISEIPNDFTWLKPSKRAISAGIYLPSVKKENIDIIVAIDTSGSITKKILSEFLGEIIKLSRSFDFIDVTLLTCDTKVHDVFQLRNREIIQKLKKIKIHGGGGTNFIPVFEWIEENQKNTKLLIYLTDGYGIYPKKEIIPTIWITTGRCPPLPFKKVIEVGKYA